MSSILQMALDCAITALKSSGKDLKRAEASFPKGKMFDSSEDRQSAYQMASNALQLLKERLEKGEAITPIDAQNYVVDNIAWVAWGRAYGQIGLSLAMGQKASKYVQEAREAIQILKQRKPEVAETFERQLKTLTLHFKNFIKPIES
jgi:hypothetical protein